MLTSTLRELNSHAQSMRKIVAGAFARGQLSGRSFPDRAGNVIDIVIGDSLDEIASRSRFATRLPGVLGQYFETWVKSGDDVYALQKAYLHLLFGSQRETAEDIVFVHTEPQIAAIGADAKQRRIARWRSGPHLHIKASRFGLGRCHLHLDTCNEPCPALKSLSNYRKQIQMMIEMLADELELYFDPAQA